MVERMPARSHLSSEETAPPYAVTPFASSPFVHPTPQSRRRTSGDLSRAPNLHRWGGMLCIGQEIEAGDYENIRYFSYNLRGTGMSRNNKQE